jgi:hypothetical protein
MIDENTLPHRGDEINGYRASVSTGLRPRLFRFLLHDTNLRTAYIAQRRSRLLTIPGYGKMSDTAMRPTTTASGTSGTTSLAL